MKKSYFSHFGKRFWFTKVALLWVTLLFSWYVFMSYAASTAFIEERVNYIMRVFEANEVKYELTGDNRIEYYKTLRSIYAWVVNAINIKLGDSIEDAIDDSLSGTLDDGTGSTLAPIVTARVSGIASTTNPGQFTNKAQQWTNIQLQYQSSNVRSTISYQIFRWTGPLDNSNLATGTNYVQYANLVWNTSSTYNIELQAMPIGTYSIVVTWCNNSNQCVSTPAVLFEVISSSTSTGSVYNRQAKKVCEGKSVSNGIATQRFMWYDSDNKPTDLIATCTQPALVNGWLICSEKMATGCCPAGQVAINGNCTAPANVWENCFATSGCKTWLTCNSGTNKCVQGTTTTSCNAGNSFNFATNWKNCVWVTPSWAIDETKTANATEWQGTATVKCTPTGWTVVTPNCLVDKDWNTGTGGSWEVVLDTCTSSYDTNWNCNTTSTSNPNACLKNGNNIALKYTTGIRWWDGWYTTASQKAYINAWNNDDATNLVFDDSTWWARWWSAADPNVRCKIQYIVNGVCGSNTTKKFGIGEFSSTDPNNCNVWLLVKDGMTGLNGNKYDYLMWGQVVTLEGTDFSNGYYSYKCAWPNDDYGVICNTLTASGGTARDAATNCAAKPNYPNAIFQTKYSPYGWLGWRQYKTETEMNTNSLYCGYTCKTGYTGPDCNDLLRPTWMDNLWFSIGTSNPYARYNQIMNDASICGTNINNSNLSSFDGAYTAGNIAFCKSNGTMEGRFIFLEGSMKLDTYIWLGWFCKTTNSAGVEIGNFCRTSHSPRPMAACGTASTAAWFASTPTTNLCVNGTAWAVTRQWSYWNWECSGSGPSFYQDGKMKCSAKVDVSAIAECGEAHWTTTNPMSSPSNSTLCKAGSALKSASLKFNEEFAILRNIWLMNWEWSCTKSGAAYETQCWTSMLDQPDSSSYTSKYPRCGSAWWDNLSYAPDVNLCYGQSVTSSTPTFDTTKSQWVWNCNKWTYSAECRSGVGSTPWTKWTCGTAHNVSTSVRPATGLCLTGNATWDDNTATDGDFNWKCSNTLGTSSCKAYEKWTCGTANDKTLNSKPTSNLCTRSGDLFGTVNGSGPWTWTCKNTYGESTCSANSTTTAGNPGQCGTAHSTTPVFVQPSTNLCANGSVDWDDSTWSSGFYTWSCYNGIWSVNCRVPKNTNYTYSWKIGAWGMCHEATELWLPNCRISNRSVECKRNDGEVAWDFYCSSPKPETFTYCSPSSATSPSCMTAPAYTYSWSFDASSWSSCAGPCGTNNASQSKSAKCLRNDGLESSTAYCTGTRPADQVSSCTSNICQSLSCLGWTTTKASPDSSNTCYYSWTTTPAGQSAIASVPSGGGTLNGICGTDGNWSSWILTCPNIASTVVTCAGGWQTFYSLDQSNQCRVSFDQKNAGQTVSVGSGAYDDYQSGVTGSALCRNDGNWSYQINCPNKTGPKTCPMGSDTLPSSSGLAECTFNYPSTVTGQWGQVDAFRNGVKVGFVKSYCKDGEWDPLQTSFTCP